LKAHSPIHPFTHSPELFFSFRFLPAERHIFAKKENLTASAWAEKYRHVVKSSRPGQWRNENNPALKGVMDLMDYARKNFVLVKSVQSGGSESAYNFLLKRMDTSSNNALLVMETERKTARTMKQRLIPAIKETKKIAEKLSTNPDDTTNYAVTLRTGFNLNIGWSNSVVALASDPYETVILDEIDKYEKMLNIEEAKDRITTYNATGKVIMFSTPGHSDGPIMHEYKVCEAHYEFHAVCPECRQAQVMTFQNFTWPDKDKAFKDDRERHKTANVLERDRLVRYQCEHCGALWNDYERDKALSLGEWRPQEEVNKRPVSIGVKFPSWLSPFKSLSFIASRWLRAQGNIEKLQKWYNNEAAEPFSEALSGKSLNEEILYHRRHPYGPADANWSVPMPACVLTCFVDVQANRLELEVVAWSGEGNYESWGIEYQTLYGDPEGADVWASLDKYLQKEFLHESGNKMQIAVCGIDEGFKSTKVREFVAKKRRVFNTKGSSHHGKQLLTINRSRQPKLTRMGKLYIQPLLIGTIEAKKTLFSWMEITEPGPGFMHYHEGYSFDYFKMLTAEKMDVEYKQGGFPHIIFKPKFEGIRNEALDIRVGNYAMIKFLNPSWQALSEGLKAQSRSAAEQKPEKRNPHSALRNRKGGWVKGWK